MNNISQGLLGLNYKLKIITLSTSKHPLILNKLDLDYKKNTLIEGVFVDTKLNIIDAFSNLVTYDSYNISRFFSPDFNSLLIDTLNNNDFDIIHLESLFTTPYIKTIRDNSTAKIILRSHNLEYIIWERLSNESNNPAKKIYLKILSSQLKKYEIDILNLVDGIATISSEDLAKYKHLNCNKPLINIPFSINIDKYISKDKILDIKNIKLFHLGSMNWKPNLEAVSYLLKAIWPHIYTKFPNLSLHIAGREMPEWMVSNNIQGLTNHGEIRSSTDFMNDHDIMIVPLLSAGGIRVKIIEGMALGKTIISTKIGAEGIDYTDGENIIIANTTEEITDKISYLLTNPEKIKDIGTNAKKFVRSYYDNIKITKKLSTFYNEVINNNI
jgi:glycosyltransferase involved in cell wall biosynthesis